MKRLIYLIGLVVILSLSSVSSLDWTNSTFNNSRSLENLFFIQNENISRSLEIPESINAITRAFLNISGYVNLNTSQKTTLDSGVGERIRGVARNDTAIYILYADFADTLANITTFDLSMSATNSFTVALSYASDSSAAGGALFHDENEPGIVYVGSTNNDLSRVNLTSEAILGSYGRGGFSTAGVGRTTNNLTFQLAQTAADGPNLFQVNSSGSTIIWDDLCNATGGDDLLHFNISSNPSATQSMGLMIMNDHPYVSFPTVSSAGTYLRADIDNIYCLGTPDVDGSVNVNLIPEDNFTLDSIITNFLPFSAFYYPRERQSYVRVGTVDGDIDAYNGSFPNSTFLEVGTPDGIREWNVTGEFNTTNFQITNLTSVINSFLNSCTISAGNCQIPFLFHSERFGVINYFNLFFDNEGFLEVSQSFDNLTYETDQESFSINLTYDTGRYDFIAADLLYNGTRKTATQIGSGTNILFNVTFDLPLIESGDESEIRNLTWEISLTEGATTTAFNSTIQQQNVSRLHLQQCDATFTVLGLNFTSFKEQDNTRINPFYFAGDFNFWLGSGTVKRDSALSNASSNEINYCISPVDRDFSVDANIEYNDVINSSVYNTRNYFFQQDLVNNQTQHIPLFLLESDDSTSFILKVQDTNLLPVVDALIIIQRFDPGTGNFTNVSIAKTDDNGQTVGFFKTETVDYKFIIRKNGELLLETTQQKVVPETAPFTLTFTVGADAGAPWTRFEDLSNLTKTLVYNSTTTNVTFTYVDTSNIFTSGRLTLQRNNLSGFSETICDINSTSSSATLTCDTGNITGSYTASAFITRGTDIFLVDQITFSVETFSSVAGFLGIFLAWLIILVSSFAFKFNEIAGIVLMNLAVITVNIVGMVNFGALFIFGMMGVSVIIIVLLKK